MDWFPICMGAFGVAFIVFIFLKSYLDDKKERRVLTEIFQQHGIRTNAKVVGFQEHHTYGRGIPGRFEIDISFRYPSPKIGDSPCTVKLWTNDPACKDYPDEIPIVYVPPYIDYLYELTDSAELIRQIGQPVNIYAVRLLLFEKDIARFTDMRSIDELQRGNASEKV